MSDQLTEGEIEHSRAVQSMFAGIAGRYDLLNHLLSMNIDKRWRKMVRKYLDPILADREAIVLDVACGTGDLSIELQNGSAAAIYGTDFCRPMLEKARAKAGNIPFIEADAMSLAFSDGAFDAVTIAFGLRNLPNVPAGLAELFRVTRPGGRLVILEFSSPSLPGFRTAFNYYFSHILPRIGGFVSGKKAAYEYLPASVSRFPDQNELAGLMEQAGFESVRYSDLTGGIAAIHHGTRPVSTDGS